MRTKDLVQASLLVAIGFILHAVFPPIVLGMKPDFSLGMMFVILMFKRDMKLGFLVALATGIFTALTTNFPGGQIANIVDKMITFLAVSALIPLLMDRVNNKVSAGIIAAIGTLISGAVFLGTAAFIVGLPGPFTILFYSVVLPAAAVNAVTVVIVFTVVGYSLDITEKDKNEQMT